MDAIRAILAASLFLLVGAGPTTKPSFDAWPRIDQGMRFGSITFSDGHVIKGNIFADAGGLRVLADRSFDAGYVPLNCLKAIDVVVVSERKGVRTIKYKFTLTNGSLFLARVGSPIYVESDGKIAGYILHKTQKAGMGEALKDMAYVKSVRFSDGSTRAPEEEASTNSH